MKRIAVFPASIAMALVALVSGAALAQDMPSFDVSMKNGVVTPRQLQVPAHKPFRLVVTNAGSATAEFESKALHIEKVVAAGMNVVLTLRGLPAGSYEFVDEFTEDQDTAHGVIIAK